MRALLLTLMIAGNVPDDEDLLTCTIKFKNGSIVRGQLRGLEKVHLKTRYGTLAIPLKEVRSVTWGEVRKEERDTVVATDGTFRGWIEDLPPLEIETGYGSLKIPSGAIQSLQLSRGGGLGDDFESGLLDRWSIYGTWTAKDGKLQATTAATYGNVALFNEDLPDSYALEVEITGNNMAGVLWHAENQTNSIGLWVYPTQVAVYGGGGTFYNQSLANWQTPVPTSYTVRIEVDGQTATVSINDVKLGTVTTPHKGGKVGLFLYQGQATFDNFRITR